MKIVMFTECLAGGVLTYLNNVCNILDDKGFEVHLIYSRKVQTPSYEKLKKFFKEGVKLKEVPFERRKIKSYFIMYYTYKKIISDLNPDIVHFHSSFSGGLGRFIIGTKKKSPLKSFYTPHGYSFLKKSNSKLKNEIFKMFEGVLQKISHETEILPISKSEYNSSLEIVSRSKVKLVSTGIDNELIDSILHDEEKIKREKKYIVSVGRLSVQKNPFLFIDIAKECKKRNIEVEFIWIGDGELRDEIQKEIKINGLGDIIHITGWLNYSQVIKMMWNYTDIYVQTSLWEGLPLTILEAMYLESVVIVNEAPGNTDPIVFGENGFIAKSVDDFVNNVEWVLENDTYSESFRKSAYSTVTEEYLMNKNINILSDIYKSNI